MAPKSKLPNNFKNKKKKTSNSPPLDGMFSGMFVFLVDFGVQPRRLQIWKQRLEQMGATIEGYLSKRVTHIFAMTLDALHHKIDSQRLLTFKGKILQYQWLEDSLRLGEKVSEDFYLLKEEPSGGESRHPPREDPNPAAKNPITNDEAHRDKKSTPSPQSSRESSGKSEGTATSDEYHKKSITSKVNDEISSASFSGAPNSTVVDASSKTVSDLPYNPPDLNKNITDIFKKLIDIYRALGEDRRSFSYYKAIPVIEKLPFKIESADQVKHLPAIGKSLCDHIQEIVSTGKLSKLEFFESDEKVKTISLFGEVWGVGPATALKLYEKGHRTLEDLKNEPSLTKAQKLGLQYFDDIKTRIPRHEVAEMEKLLQNVGDDILPGVVIVCGGSYRRGKSSCGDMDIVITHPDGQSHRGFLAKFVTRLKDMNFVREDLVFSIHSEEGTDSGVDTYFGLCTYPGRELRHRIDLKVYPKDIYLFGLIHWTGNDTLNRRLRILAESKGFRLDDNGLFPATPGSGTKRGTRGLASLHFNTEKEVFEFLGFPWLEPHERNL
ncbi:hypothetical protein RND81_07G191000 [Saponaria officinalis]|uniref:DNA polymerase n=1 Tax=Saponaria officinalis TaxID=3572 RepID=A0AAW1JTS6_SAPOF